MRWAKWRSFIVLFKWHWVSYFKKMSIYNHWLTIKAYLSAIIVTNISQFLPTRWRHKSTGIDKGQNYVTVTLCINLPSVLWRCWLGGRKGIWPVKTRSSAIAEWRAMRLVSNNLANCHATVQKLLIRQVLAKPMVWSWRFSRRQCVTDNVHSTMTQQTRLPLSQVS